MSRAPRGHVAGNLDVVRDAFEVVGRAPRGHVD